MFILAIIVIAAIVFFVYRAKKNSAAEQSLTLESVATEVKSTLDVNGDGKVNLADVVAVEEKVKVAAKKGAAKARTAAKKAKSKLKVAK